MSKRQKSPEDLIYTISEACAQLGWELALNNSQDQIDGLIIGSKEFIAGIVGQLEEAEDFSEGLFEFGGGNGSGLQ